jgi:hypothetical protein
VIQSIRGPEAYLEDCILKSLLLLDLLPVVGGILQHTNVFWLGRLSRRHIRKAPRVRTMSQEYLTLSVGGPRLGIWIGVPEFIGGFDIDLSTLGDGAEVGIRGGAKTEDRVP